MASTSFLISSLTYGPTYQLVYLSMNYKINFNGQSLISLNYKIKFNAHYCCLLIYFNAFNAHVDAFVTEGIKGEMQ